MALRRGRQALPAAVYVQPDRRRRASGRRVPPRHFCSSSRPDMSFVQACRQRCGAIPSLIKIFPTIHFSLLSRGCQCMAASQARHTKARLPFGQRPDCAPGADQSAQPAGMQHAGEGESSRLTIPAQGRPHRGFETVKHPLTIAPEWQTDAVAAGAVIQAAVVASEYLARRRG